MKTLRKIFHAILISLLFLSAGPMPAFAWEFIMSDVDGTLTAGETYNITVEFNGDSTDYLDLLSFAIEWNTSLIELADFPELAEYTRGSGFNQYTLWMESPIASIPDVDNGRWYDVSGETDLDHMGEFYPEATGETQMATFTFTALESGYFEDLASFYFTPENNLTELVDINGESYSAEDGQLQIFKDGTSSVMAPVPVPAAAWLFGSGLLGLLTVRRRNK